MTSTTTGAEIAPINNEKEAVVDLEEVTEGQYCTWQSGGGYLNPPEYCDLSSMEGDDYCEKHGRHVRELEHLVESTPSN
jgi:hypothetical protein